MNEENKIESNNQSKKIIDKKKLIIILLAIVAAAIGITYFYVHDKNEETKKPNIKEPIEKKKEDKEEDKNKEEKTELQEITALNDELCAIPGVSNCVYTSDDDEFLSDPENSGFTQAQAGCENYFEITVDNSIDFSDLYDTIYYDESFNFWQYSSVIKINSNQSQYIDAGYRITNYRFLTTAMLLVNNKKYPESGLDNITLIADKYLAIDYSGDGHFTDLAIVDNSLNEIATLNSYNGGSWNEGPVATKYNYFELGDHMQEYCSDLSSEKLNEVASTDGYIEYTNGSFIKKTTNTHYYKDVCLQDDNN